MLRRRRCNTTSSNTTSVPTSSLGGVASVSQLPPQDGDHFFPLSSNHVPLGTYSGTCPRSQGAAFYGTYVHVACPRSQRAAQFCGGCLNEVDRVIHQSTECVSCPRQPPPDCDHFFQTLKHGRVNVQALLLYCSVTSYLHQRMALPPYVTASKNHPGLGGFPDRHLTSFPNLGYPVLRITAPQKCDASAFAVCQMPEFHGQHASYVS